MGRTILCFGDSNTHGTMPMESLGPSQRHPVEARWPAVMAVCLGDEWTVIDAGHPGRTTVHDDPVEGDHKNGKRVLLSVLESHKPLDLVILMLGTNDLKARFSMSAGEIAQSVEKLTQIVRQSACGPNSAEPDILVVTPTPILETGVLADIFRGGAAKSEHLAEAFTAMGERANVPVFDAGSVCAVSTTDGIHFEPNALRALGETLAGQVKQQAGQKGRL